MDISRPCQPEKFIPNHRNNKLVASLAWGVSLLYALLFAHIRNIPKYILVCKRLSHLPAWTVMDMAFNCEKVKNKLTK